MMKIHKELSTVIYAVKLINIERSVSVKTIRQLVKQYTRKIAIFRKRVTNMIRKGDWNLYIEFRSLHTLILFLLIDLPVQRQVFIGLPLSTSRDSDHCFCSKETLNLLEPLIFEEKYLLGLYQHRDKLSASLKRRVVTSTLSVKITGLPKSYRVTHLLNYIKETVGGLLFWKSTKQQSISTKGIFINMADHEKAQKVIDLAKKQFISYQYVKVGFLPLEINAIELLSPFIEEFSSIIPFSQKPKNKIAGQYIPFNKDLATSQSGSRIEYQFNKKSSLLLKNKQW